MARDYARKLVQMRAYYRTPAGKAAHDRAYEKTLEKRGKARKDTAKPNPAPLVAALKNWR